MSSSTDTIVSASAPGQPSPDPVSHDELVGARLVARRKPGQWVTAAVCLAVLAFAVQSMVRNPRFQWTSSAPT